MRGLSIVGMLFFSLNYMLTDDLPMWLRHNMPGRFLPGDLVLPLFIFTSGLAVAATHDEERRKTRPSFLRALRRIAGQLVIALGLSRFSAGHIGGMDEVMLNLILWIPVTLFAQRSSVLVCMSLLTLGLYPVLESHGALPIRADRYLGGYGAALFYLPVMALGVLVSRAGIGGTNARLNARAYFVGCLLFGVSLALWPARKLEVTPSFVLASCLTSMLVWQICGKVSCRWLECVGRFPRTSWVFMFVGLIIPLRLIGQHYAIVLPWWGACCAALLSVVVLLLVVQVTSVIETVFRFIKGSAHGDNRILAAPFSSHSLPTSLSRSTG